MFGFLFPTHPRTWFVAGRRPCSYVGGGGGMGESAARVSAGGLYSSGLNKGCLSSCLCARDLFNVAQETEVLCLAYEGEQISDYGSIFGPTCI